MPVQLVFEITETAMMRDVEQARALLEALSARGIGIALDDFGMGYSSLAQIRHLPIDYIKIDRQFISEISSHREDLIIVSGMIDLSHSLGLAVVAEGVETAAQAHLLTELGCNFAQGYFFGKPCSPADFAALLERQARPSARPSTTGATLSPASNFAELSPGVSAANE
jgi:EAL domain-containing protein (putative c-di-GMP-specific phosphodiesterase class I)